MNLNAIRVNTRKTLLVKTNMLQACCMGRESHLRETMFTNGQLSELALYWAAKSIIPIASDF